MNNTKTTVYFHIGANKTGTTYLQRLFARNRESLEEHRILYPNFDVEVPVNKNRNGYVFEVSLNPNGDNTVEEQCIEKLIAWGTSGKYDKIILSDEDMYFRRSFREGFFPDFQKRLAKAGMDLKLVMYIRRQDEYMLSLWRHKIKRYYVEKSVERFLELTTKKYQANYFQFLELFAEEIGRENILVRVYDRAAFKKFTNRMAGDFLDTIGADPEISLEEPEALGIANESIVGVCLEAKRRMNATGFVEKRQFFQERGLLEVQRVLKEEGLYPKSEDYSRSHRIAYMEQFAEDNAKLARLYLHREDGKLFEEVSSDMLDEETEFTDAQIFDVLVKLLVYNHDAVQTLKDENKELKAKIKELQKKDYLRRAYHFARRKIVRDN